MPRLHLRLLGGIRAEIERDGRMERARIEPKRLALLAYLAADVAGHLHTRDSLIAVFWPERPERLARLALRQSLHHLSRRLAPDIFLRDGHQLVGLAAERVGCDVHRFERALREQRPRDALQEYRGDFIEGFVLADQPEPFEEWIQLTRTRYRDAAVSATALVATEEGAASAGTHPALGWIHRALLLSPYSEELLGQAVELRLRGGDRGGAIGEVRRFTQRLWNEMGLEPSRRVEEMREQAQARDRRGQARESAARGTAVRLPDRLLRELERVLAAEEDRIELPSEIKGPDGAEPVHLIVEPLIRAGRVRGASVRIEPPTDQPAS